MKDIELFTGDCLEWGRTLPDDSIDLLFTSPPYLEARTYGIGAGRKLDAWVSWMMEVVAVFAPKVKGLIAINCEGQTRNYQYLPAPFLLMADLHRAGFNLRKPAVFQRHGIPGSGGPDWLRNCWEPIICISRPGRLPWSDATACGHKPKWEPGGAPSYQKPNGERVGHKMRVSTPDKTQLVQAYIAPELSNPGNVINCGTVGGGHMGHPLAIENEAPFPMKLADFFILSFCPPDGVACDPFCGSGTVCESAITHGRKFVGGDIRASQVALTRRRLSGVTPATLFHETTLTGVPA